MRLRDEYVGLLLLLLFGEDGEREDSEGVYDLARPFERLGGGDLSRPLTTFLRGGVNDLLRDRWSLPLPAPRLGGVRDLLRENWRRRRGGVSLRSRFARVRDRERDLESDLDEPV